MCSSRLQTRGMDGFSKAHVSVWAVLIQKGQINNGLNKIVAVESLSNLQKMLRC